MAHRSSSAALHAARTILEHYTLSVIPRDQLRNGVSAIPTLQASDGYVSVMIDYTTNAFCVCNLRPELKHWIEQLHLGQPTPRQIFAFVHHMVEEMDKVPKDAPVQELQTFAPDTAPEGLKFASEQSAIGYLRFRQSTARAPRMTISTASLQATTYLFAFYTITPKKKTFFNHEALQNDVAKQIEVSLGLRKAMPALELARKCEAGLRAGQLDLRQIKAYFREFGVLLEHLPNYQQHEEETKLLV